MAKGLTISLTVLGAAVLGAVLVVIRAERPKAAHAQPSAEASVQQSDVPLEPAPGIGTESHVVDMATAQPAAAVAAVAVRRAERSVMAELRELGESNPSLSMQLAREGNDRFPTSADAPERGWIIVKSLVNLGRFDDAKSEAVALVDKYPESPWAADVARHMLVNPLDAVGDDEP